MSQNAKILYIDDEKDLLDLAASFFLDEKLHIHTCTCFEQAIKMIREHNYEIIISDSKMPTGSGAELLNAIKDEGIFNGKFILVTGNVDNMYENNRHAFDDVLFKPLHFQDLINKVKQLVST
ncbi:MAG: response regulator [Bacteriovoracaceae bacterium]